MQASLHRTCVALALLVLACLPACHGDGEGDLVGSSGPFALTFSLDASFQGPHGGQPISWAVVRSSGGAVVAAGNGTVSATKDPSFSFTTGAVMKKGAAYEVHYWIDSNFGGGTPGVCDSKDIDHQWSTEFPTPTNDIDLTVSHESALTEYVCDTFSP